MGLVCTNIVDSGRSQDNIQAVPCASRLGQPLFWGKGMSMLVRWQSQWECHSRWQIESFFTSVTKDADGHVMWKL